MKRYSLGFAFGTNQGEETVLLIRKTKPSWQAGKLNGVGGHIEDGETPIEAMVREFQEETGIQTARDDWRHYLILRGPKWEMHVYTTSKVDISQAQTLTEELVVTTAVKRGLDAGCLDNVPWLVAAAKDQSLTGGYLAVDYGAFEAG